MSSGAFASTDPVSYWRGTRTTRTTRQSAETPDAAVPTRASRALPLACCIIGTIAATVVLVSVALGAVAIEINHDGQILLVGTTTSVMFLFVGIVSYWRAADRERARIRAGERVEAMTTAARAVLVEELEPLCSAVADLREAVTNNPQSHEAAIGTNGQVRSGRRRKARTKAVEGGNGQPPVHIDDFRMLKRIDEKLKRSQPVDDSEE